MIVVKPREDVATDARGSQRCRERCRQSNRIQGGVYGQGDPPGDVVIGQACVVSSLLPENDRRAFVLFDYSFVRQLMHLGRSYADEDKLALTNLRTQTLEYLV